MQTDIIPDIEPKDVVGLLNHREERFKEQVTYDLNKWYVPKINNIKQWTINKEVEHRWT